MKRPSKGTRTTWLWMTVAVLVLCGVVKAQEGAPPPPQPGPGLAFRAGGPMVAMGGPDDAMVFVGFEGELNGKTVTGAPFTASFSTQTKQVLADGNQIQRSNSGTFSRDSQGRTRREMTLPGIGIMASGNQVSPHVVMINDPVAGSQYILEVDRKVARKVEFGRGGKHGHNGENGAGITFRARNESNVTTTSLGNQVINGVSAEGTRTTRTIPAGAIGNTNPIVVTVERWYSSDLQTVVMMKRDDPRMGETTFQLTNIQKREPEASLFQVPSDYTVKPGRGGQIIRRLGPGPDTGVSAPPAPQN